METPAEYFIFDEERWDLPASAWRDGEELHGDGRMTRLIPCDLTCAKCEFRTSDRCPNAVFRTDGWVYVGERHPACVRHKQN